MRWPWISIVLAVILVVSPFGQEAIHDGFFSGEALSRNIAQPLFFMGFALLVLIAVLEWLLRLAISKRRARGTTT
jgi:hypothetical protein